MSINIPTVEEVDARIEAVQAELALLKRQRRVSASIGETMERDGECEPGTTERIHDTFGGTG